MKGELVEDARRTLESTSVGLKTWELWAEPVITDGKKGGNPCYTRLFKTWGYEVNPL